MKCGLLGRHLAHSYSPAIHKYFGDYSYELFDIPAEELGSFLKTGTFRGLNVTSPYKQAVIPWLDELSPLAAQLQAVNTVVRREDGTLVGHNTDYSGFYSTVTRSGLQLSGKKVLILGSGGASNMAKAVLQSLDAKAVVISRNGINHYGNLQLHTDAAAIVNATPVGMYPDNGGRLLDLRIFPQLEGVFDMIYNPARTPLLLDAEKLGIPAFNGLWMLVAQAAETSQLFTGNPVDPKTIKAAWQSLHRRMENIILIGMPGCGKSTVGAALAAATGRQFVDTDQRIQEKLGCSIPEIINTKGQAYFRQLETEILREVGKESSLVISTGGGCVTQECNYPLLHQNGSILWLHRQLAMLSTDGRPLSVDLAQLYAKREPLYRSFSDISIDNNGTLQETLSHILQELPL